MRYPNLAEIIRFHPYHIDTFAGFGDVTTELLVAGIRGDEELRTEELNKIARYASIPAGVIMCPHLIKLGRFRYRHIVMVGELEDNLDIIKGQQEASSRHSCVFMDYGLEDEYKEFFIDFIKGYATYGRYLGIKEKIDQTLMFIENEKRKPRGLSGLRTAQKGGMDNVKQGRG